MYAHGIDSIEIPTAQVVIRLREVWHVPNIWASLLLVTRMVNAGYIVRFDRPTSYISKTWIRTERGNRKGSWY